MESMPIFKGDGVIVSGENVTITTNVTDKGVELLTVYERENRGGFYIWFMVYCGATIRSKIHQPCRDADEERVREWNRRVRR